MEKLSKVKIVTYFFLFCYLLVGLIIFKDFGIGIEEHFQRKSGFYWLIKFLDYLGLEQLKDLSLIRYDEIKTNFKLPTVENNLNYGVLFDLPLAFIEVVFNLEGANIFLIRHLVNFIFFFISGIFFFKILSLRFDNELISLAGTLIYLLLPKSFGSSFFDGKDLFFLSIFTINCSLYLNFVLNRNLNNVIYFAVFSAFSVSSRVFGLVIPISFLIIEVLRYVNNLEIKKLKYVLFFFIFFFLTLLIHWPFFGYLISDFSNYKNFFKVKVILQVFFDNQFFNSQDLPFSYIPTLIFNSTPVYVLLFFSIGFIYQFRRIFLRIIDLKEQSFNNDLWKGKKEKFDIFLFINFLAILTHYFIYNPNLFSGWRHYIFINLFLTYYSAYSFSIILKFYKTRYHPILFTIIFIFTIELIYKLFIYHPYQTYYMNNVISKDKKSYFEIDNLSLSRYDALNFILKDSPNKEKIYVANASWTPLEEGKFLLDKKDWNKFIFIGNENKEKADYIYTNYFYEVDINYNDKYEIPSSFKIYNELIIDDVKIYSIFKK